MANGNGRKIYANGNVYIGNWVNGKSSGYGEYQHMPNGIKYKGQWVNDKQQGRGRENWPDGTKYDGEYYQG